MVPAENLAQAASILGDSEELVLACHVNPDGDALGTMLGLAVAARNAGKRVLATFPEPFVVPSSLSFLPTDLLVPPSRIPATPKVMVAVDTGAPDRLGELATNAADSEQLIVIDHHESNEGFGAVRLIDPSAAASAQVAMPLIRALGWPVTPEVATCLHTAVVTDTGRFQYAYTTPTTLNLGAQLLAAGADHVEIGQRIYERAPFGYLRLLAKVLERATLEQDRGLVWSVVGAEDLHEAAVGQESIDGVIDVLRLAEEAGVAALFKDMGKGQIKGSLRSRGGTDVAAIASSFGGGGHHNAAGFTTELGLDTVLERIRGLLEPR